MWVIAAIVILLVGAGALWIANRGAGGPTVATEKELAAAEDALHRRTVEELSEFTDWLDRHDVDGYIGEVGIPNDGDVDRWGLLAERWLQEAEEADLWVSVWSAGEWWGQDYTFSVFVPEDDAGPLARATPTGQLVSLYARHGEQPLGVNVSGGEFGSPGSTEEITEFSNDNSGEYGEAYRYDSAQTFEYLASQDVETVRIPFRWERIQPALGEDLDATELARLRRAIEHAGSAGLQVILDVHNYGAYHLSDGTQGVRQVIGSEAVTVGHFADLWRRLSLALADEPGVVAYDLMNEPANLQPAGERTPAQVWEDASQAALTAVRATGDETLVMVAGYQYSHVWDWTEQHPRPWIDDPADNYRYAAHHYWQRDEADTYETVLAAAREAGY